MWDDLFLRPSPRKVRLTRLTERLCDIVCIIDRGGNRILAEF